MFDLTALFAALDAEGLGSWGADIEPLIAERIADRAHGNLYEWRDAIDRLPSVARQPAELDVDEAGAASIEFDASEMAAARDALLRLRPWRKGPFRIGDILIDAEWRSQRKWDRVQRVMSPLSNRLVLDVGCGNGYYAMRMCGAGARTVIGVDPTLLHIVQFHAIARFLEPLPIHLLPLRLHDLPANSGAFDSVFSMGVLYHQPSPIEHLRQLRGALRPGGELIVETLVLPGEQALSRTPSDRYARMRNVWHLPSLAELGIWLSRCGFDDVEVADVTATTSHEQRSTEWMPFESLSEALDPDRPDLTVEGWPAPRRAILLARRPG